MTDHEVKTAETRLLRAASKSEKSSASLLAAAERGHPSLSADTVRYAYWTLVNEGKLERTARGVRKPSSK